jgi:transposase-like protein
MRRHLAPEDKARLVLLFIKSKQSAAALCRKHRISESNYYSWRKLFVLAGTEALKRSSKRGGRKSRRRRTKCEDSASVDAEIVRLLQSVQAARTQRFDRQVSLSEAARLAIVDLINTASIPKKLAAADAGVARSTYYRWRERTRLSRSLKKQRSRPHMSS